MSATTYPKYTTEDVVLDADYTQDEYLSPLYGKVSDYVLSLTLLGALTALSPCLALMGVAASLISPILAAAFVVFTAGMYLYLVYRVVITHRQHPRMRGMDGTALGMLVACVILAGLGVSVGAVNFSSTVAIISIVAFLAVLAAAFIIGGQLIKEARTEKSDGIVL